MKLCSLWVSLQLKQCSVNKKQDIFQMRPLPKYIPLRPSLRFICIYCRHKSVIIGKAGLDGNACILEVPGSNFYWETNYSKVFRGLIQSLQIKNIQWNRVIQIFNLCELNCTRSLKK